jgi:hypothetical protein
VGLAATLQMPGRVQLCWLLAYPLLKQGRALECVERQRHLSIRLVKVSGHWGDLRPDWTAVICQAVGCCECWHTKGQGVESSVLLLGW